MSCPLATSLQSYTCSFWRVDSIPHSPQLPVTMEVPARLFAVAEAYTVDDNARRDK